MEKHREAITSWLQEGKSKTWIAKQLQKNKEFKDLTVDACRFRLNRWLRRNDDSNHPALEEECDTLTETNQYKTPPKLSALKPDGKIMTVEEFCDFHGLDPKLSRSFKLVTHTGIPYYNIASVNLDVESEIDIDATIQRIVEKHSKPVVLSYPKPVKEDKILQIIISDVHIGLDPNKDGYSLYGGKWSSDDLYERMDTLVNEAIQLDLIYDGFDTIQIVDLGDFLDGYDGQTVRRNHELDQNMTNEEMFDHGVGFRMGLLSRIANHLRYNKIISYCVCNSNHSSSFDYMANKAYQLLVENMYNNERIEVVLERRFMGYLETGNWIDVFTHGKDEKSLKFGLKPKLDEKGSAYIENYLKHHRLLGTGKNIVVHKGDSHQLLFDNATSLDFSYHNYLSFAPASNWVQTNFNKSRSGFTLIVKDKFSSRQAIHNYEFGWGSNSLK